MFFVCLFVFFLCANYCLIVTTNFSRCCGWLRFAAQPKLLIFTLGIQTFVLPYNKNKKKRKETYYIIT